MIRLRFASSFVIGAIALLVTGCSPAIPIGGSNGDASGPLSHALIYVIHGDGDYRYHEDGEAKRADLDALAEAQLVARNAPGTEVFIYHQQARGGLLGLFSRDDGTVYHYRDGRLIEKASYKRDPTGHGLEPEASFYLERRDERVGQRTFLYYGHELAEEGGARYHSSYSDHPFGLHQLRDGLRAFGAEASPFELVVLSTCNNGSPGAVARLAPLTRRILASPGNLHLSYIDSQPLHRVATSSNDIDALAVELAQWAHDRLTARTKTAVTLALYQTDELKPFLDDLESSYSDIRNRAMSGRFAVADHADCRDVMPDVDFNSPGVRQWYRPAAFGRQSRNQTHSGWGCPVPVGQEEQ